MLHQASPVEDALCAMNKRIFFVPPLEIEQEPFRLVQRAAPKVESIQSVAYA
jgi:hypothetical protein